MKDQWNKISKDCESVLAFIQHADPNGEHTMMSLVDYPLEYIEMLERWKSDLGPGSTEEERVRFDDMISTLFALHFYTK